MFNTVRACAYQQKAMAAVGGDLSKINMFSAEDLQAMAQRYSRSKSSETLRTTSSCSSSSFPLLDVRPQLFALNCSPSN